MATIPQEPRRIDFNSEAEFGAAFEVFANRREAARIASLNFSNDDSQNQGTVNAAAQTSGGATVTNSAFSGQKPGQIITQSYDKPGIRKKNVLSTFSSSTYSLTLYMCTTQAANQFKESGGVFPAGRSDIFIVAQSAGVNNVSEQRLITKSRQLGPGQTGYDYYIDDLIMTTIMPTNKNTGSTALFKVRFKIVEPLGFNFVGDLVEMGRKVNGLSNVANNQSSNPTEFQQTFILGIKFYGYDVNGIPVKHSDPNFANFFNGSTDSNSVAERYISLQIADFKYSVDEKSTEYSIECIADSTYAAAGQINGVTKGNFELNGKTVKDFLVGTSGSGNKSLVDLLNSKNDDIKNRGYTQYATTYEIKFFDKNKKLDMDGALAMATLPNNLDITSEVTPMVSASDAFQADSLIAGGSQTKNVIKQKSSFPAGTSITKIIETIIEQSSYISDAIDRKSNQTSQNQIDTTRPIKALDWFSINYYTMVKEYDKKLNGFSYHVVYEIVPKEKTQATSEYVSRTTPYKGPFKEYDYIFTGKNTEILKFDQNFNNQYFVARQLGKNQTAINNVSNDVRSAIVASSPVTGVFSNKGGDIASQVTTNLYSPADQVNTTIKILGDPDYIMTQIGVSSAQSQNKSPSKYYSQDGSIDPYSADVLIQINFRSPSDYADDGLLSIGRVQFYGTDAPLKAGIEGIVYMLMNLESEFSRGIFTQTLKMVIVPESQLLGRPNSRSIQPDEQVDLDNNADVRQLPQPSGAGSLTDINDDDTNTQLSGELPEERASDFRGPAPQNDDKNLSPITDPSVDGNLELEQRAPLNFDGGSRTRFRGNLAGSVG